MEDMKPMEVTDSGEKRLNELGYKQELKRDLSLFKLFALTMSTITLFTGIVPYYSVALLNAGPVGFSIGWWVVAFFTSFLVLSLAEICSAYPTTGSLYFWAASLAGPKYAPLASFITGWCEFVGLSVVTGGQAYAGTQLLQSLILIGTGGYNGGGYFLTKWQVVLCVYGILIIAGLVNSLPISYVATIATFSMYLQVLGGISILIMLPIIAPKVQTAKYVFTHFEDNRDVTGLPNPVYSWIAAMLLSQYALYGFDVAAHMTEETKSADRFGPMVIIGSLVFTVIFGYAFGLSLTFSMRDLNRLFDPETVTGGTYPVAQIIWDAFYDRYGNGTGAYFVLGLMYTSFVLGACSLVLATGRVIYAFSRDNGIPLSFFWRRLSKGKVPVAASWLSVAIGAIVVLPTLKYTQAFYAITSMATMAYMFSYVPPIFLRIVRPEETFPAGPFYLAKYVGKAGKVIHIISLLWVLYTCTAFSLPQYLPVTWENFNYAPAGIAFVFVFLFSWWVIDARKWFKGPVREILVPYEGKGEEQAFTKY